MSIFGRRSKASYDTSVNSIRFCVLSVFCLIGSLGWGLPGCQRAPVASQAEQNSTPIFEEVALSSGLNFTYRNGEEAGHFAILETLGGGVGLLDFDNDGLIDIFLVGGGFFDGPEQKQIKGLPCRLYRNLGSWRFVDVTEQVGLSIPPFYSHGVAIADFDADGWPDILVTGYDGLVLYHNVTDGKNGRRFIDVSESVGLPDKPGWCTSAAWGDFNQDGFPDLYVCRYVDWSFEKNPPCPGENGEPRDVCTPKYFEALPDLLFLNEAAPQGRRLREVSAVAGLRVPQREDRDYGKGLGVLVADLTGDGWPDIYVANDTTDNFLYVNQGRSGVPFFKELGLKLGVARDGGGTPNGSMGVDAADFDGSGRPSIWVTNYESELHALYRHVTRDTRQFWQFSSQLAGTAAIGQLFVGFGTVFFDFDGDGWEDIFISNGHVLRHSARGELAQRPVLLKNLGGRFQDVSMIGGGYFHQKYRGRGVAVGDLDNDGRPDLVISHVNQPVAILRNVGPKPPNWLGLKLEPSAGISRITIENKGRRLVRFVKAGGSYLSSNDPRLLIPIDDPAATTRVTGSKPRNETVPLAIKPTSINQYQLSSEAK